MAETEQNKTEEPTPYKLKRAREKGQVARGTDLGFFSALAGLSLFAVIAGVDMMLALGETTRRALTTAIDAAANPQRLPAVIFEAYGHAAKPVAVFACTVALVVLLFEIVQLRGLVFTTQPLKPDFSRLNPAKGLKRLFSMRMLKETVKNVLKMIVYSTAAVVLIRDVFVTNGASIVDAGSLARTMHDGAMRMLFVIVLIALGFAVLDQILARQDFLKQMRMSRSELTREVKDREGEPRIKRKRKELHAAFTEQARALGGLPGSDLVIVNPQHFAVALVYDARIMEAPEITAKGRNGFALMLKQRAGELSIPIFEAPPLARALYRQCEPGEPVPGSEYRAVVDLYLKLAGMRRRSSGAANA